MGGNREPGFNRNGWVTQLCCTTVLSPVSLQSQWSSHTLSSGCGWMQAETPRWAFWALSHSHACSPVNGSNSSSLTQPLQMSHLFLIPLRTPYINTWKVQDMEYASGKEKWKATEIQWKIIAQELSHEDTSRQQHTLFKKCTPSPGTNSSAGTQIAPWAKTDRRKLVISILNSFMVCLYPFVAELKTPLLYFTELLTQAWVPETSMVSHNSKSQASTRWDIFYPVLLLVLFLFFTHAITCWI